MLSSTAKPGIAADALPIFSPIDCQWLFIRHFSRATNDPLAAK
jgi:hypothetical protein